MTPMKQPRHSFCAVNLNLEYDKEQFIYVFGGILGKIKDSSKACLTTANIERYNVDLNKWEELKIQGLVPLAAFGYASYSSLYEKKLFIVGGFDG